jgi:hypothetical protein
MKTYKWIEGIVKPAKGIKEEYKDINEETEDRSFKKALKSFQNKVKECHWLRVQYKNKKGQELDRWVQIPLGRKKRIE